MRQPQEPTRSQFANPVLRYLAATRPAFLTAALMACCIGLATAHHDGVVLNGAMAVMALILALLAHAGANVLNDYYDALNGTDAQNAERVFPFTGGSRFIQNGVLTLLQMRNFGMILMACVATSGLWLMVYSAPQLFYVGLAGLFIGWAYSAPPFRLNSRGWGELCIAAGFLLIVIGTDLVQRQAFAATPLFAGFSYALLSMNLLYINQFPDRKADIAAGKLHWVARLDVRQARWGYPLIVAVAYLWVVVGIVLGLMPKVVALALLALPFSVLATMELFRHVAQPQHLGVAIRHTIAAMLVHGAMLSLGLLLG